MRRGDDPKRAKAEAERDRAQLWLQVLCKGIGRTLAETCAYYYGPALRPVIALVNTELAAAVADVDAAEIAMEPYWPRRRRTRTHVTTRGTPNPKKKKTAAVE